MEEYSLSQDEFHSRLYVVSLMATLVAAHCRHELLEGLDMFLLRPGTIPEIEYGATEFTWSIPEKAVVLFLFSTSGIMGASCLGAITKRFGCLSMALTSTARKGTTLFLSFALFQNKCTPQHLVGVTLFMTAIVINTLFKGQITSKSGQGDVQRQRPDDAMTPAKVSTDNLRRRLDIVFRRFGLGTRDSNMEMNCIFRKGSSDEVELGMPIS